MRFVKEWEIQISGAKLHNFHVQKKADSNMNQNIQVLKKT